MNYFSLLSFASTNQEGSSPLPTIILLAVMFGVMYFAMIRPQKKKQKDEAMMRDNLQIGDEVTTIGGIIGRIVTVKEDSIVIETGADRTKMKFARWSIQTNNTATQKAQEEREAAKKAQDESKQARIEAAKAAAEDKKKNKK